MNPFRGWVVTSSVGLIMSQTASSVYTVLPTQSESGGEWDIAGI